LFFGFFMSTFTSIASIITFVKSGTDLTKVAQATLNQDKSKGLSLLLEETVKAAIAASIFNNPSRLLSALSAVKSGKKTASARHWLEATTALMRGLPLNTSGDAKRIPDEDAFVTATNAAIATFNESWVKFEEARVIRATARKEDKAVEAAAEAAAAEAASAAATPATPAQPQPLAVDNEERAEFMARIDKLNDTGLALKASNDALTLTLARVTHERDELKESLDAIKAERDELKESLDAIKAERDALLASRKRAIKKGIPT
jgi:chromosome segregation ATPase